METQLILTACIVNFGLTSVKPYNQITEQVVTRKLRDGSEVQDSLQNLFDSVAKNDIRMREVYRKYLKEEVAQEQRVFGMMKEDIRIARLKNSYKNRNLRKRSEIGEHVIAAKREINEGDVPLRRSRDPPIPDPPFSSDTQKLTEALYLGGPTMYDESFPEDKEPIDVCTLPTDKAMKVCFKAERQFPFKGDYYPISDEKVTECEVYKVKFNHTQRRPRYEDKEARKCPYQPSPLFIMSGNKKVPVFILTWSSENKTDLHFDYWLNVDKTLL